MLPQIPYVVLAEQERLRDLAEMLSEQQKRGLKPCASHEDRKSLLKLGLVHWKTKIGHRYPSLRLTHSGHRVRALLNLDVD